MEGGGGGGYSLFEVGYQPVVSSVTNSPFTNVYNLIYRNYRFVDSLPNNISENPKGIGINAPSLLTLIP